MDQQTEGPTLSSNEQTEKQPLKTYSFNDLKVAFGINTTETPEVEQISEQATKLLPKAEADLQNGFYSWVIKDDVGHKGVYLSDKEKKMGFDLVQTFTNGIPREISINGIYFLGDMDVQVRLDSLLIPGQPLLPTCRVFVGGALISEQVSPADIVHQQVSAFLKSVVVDSGEGTARLDLAVTDERSPYPFVTKMLTDFEGATFDKEFTEEMFNDVSSRVPTNNRQKPDVNWVSEYKTTFPPSTE